MNLDEGSDFPKHGFGLSTDIGTGFRFNQRWRSERVGNGIQITLSFDFPTHGYGHSVDFDTGSEPFKSIVKPHNAKVCRTVWRYCRLIA